MKKYSVLLFDIDNTLLDFDKTEKTAMQKLFNMEGEELTDDFWRTYKVINGGLWKAYEQGNIPLDEVLGNRFSHTMSALGKTIDGIRWENSYREQLGKNAFLINGALEICRDLHKEYRMCIVTNGIRKTQQERLNLSGLSSFFDTTFDSQSIGYAKPDIRFYDAVFSVLCDIPKEEMLVIGDSQNADIKGANYVSLDVCWYNPKKSVLQDGLRVNFEITSLGQLRQLLLH